MKTVKLLKDRGGDKKGGRVTLPDEVADDLVKSGIAAPDAGDPPPAKAAPAATVPKAEYDALRGAATELEAENAEYAAENKKLADELKALKADLAKKP